MALQRFVIGAVGAAAVLALGACNHETANARLDTAPLAGAQMLAFSDDGANAKLASAVGVEGGPGLMLECEHGARMVHVTRMGGGAGAAVLVLDAAGVRSSLPAQEQAFEGRRLLLADAPVDAPALRAFRKSATLQVEDGGRSLTAAAAEGPAGAERFFAACEARV